jgi:hypothetical protein
MQTELEETEPTEAVKYLLAAFDRFPLVALGGMHGSQEMADFVVSLLYHPQFAAKVNAIVVEFGNARYQKLIDRFVIEGKPVEASELRPVWRDIFGSGTDAPIFEQFFRTVRAVNRSLSEGQKVRVWLGDPPVNWSEVRSIEQAIPFMRNRDRHFAEVVEHEVLARGHKAILIAGLAHVLKAIPGRNELETRPPSNFVQLLEENHPQSTWAVLPHLGFSYRNAELESRLTDWPMPGMVSLGNSWVGDLDCTLSFAAGVAEYQATYAGFKLKEVADAYLYLGPRHRLTNSTPNPAVYRGDPAYLAELERRHRILFGQPLNTAELFEEWSVRYRRPGQELSKEEL